MIWGVPSRLLHHTGGPPTAPFSRPSLHPSPPSSVKKTRNNEWHLDFVKSIRELINACSALGKNTVQTSQATPVLSSVYRFPKARDLWWFWKGLNAYMWKSWSTVHLSHLSLRIDYSEALLAKEQHKLHYKSSVLIFFLYTITLSKAWFWLVRSEGADLCSILIHSTFIKTI